VAVTTASEADIPCLDAYMQELSNIPFLKEKLPIFIEMAKSNESDTLYQGVLGIRKILSLENPPIQEVIDSGIILKLIELLANEAYKNIWFDSVWALTNVAIGNSDQVQVLVDKGIVTALVNLMDHAQGDTLDQAIWALGNIAADCVIFRNLVLQSGVIPKIVKFLKENKENKTYSKNGVWTLSNLCRSKPKPDIALFNDAFQIFADAVNDPTNSEQIEILEEALHGLSFLSEGDDYLIQQVIDSGVVPKVVVLMDHPHFLICYPSVLIVGNLCTGNDEQLDTLLSYDPISRLGEKLLSPKKMLRKNALWALSNIGAGTQSQVQQLLNHEVVMKSVVNLTNDVNKDVKREATFVMSNMVNTGTSEQRKHMIELGFFSTLVEMLKEDDARTLVVVLEGLGHFLDYGKDDAGGENLVVVQFETLGGLTRLEDLQSHPNETVYVKALDLLEKYFDVEEEDEEEEVQVNDTDAAQAAAAIW